MESHIPFLANKNHLSISLGTSYVESTNNKYLICAQVGVDTLLLNL